MCSVEQGWVAGFKAGDKLVLKSMKREQYDRGRRIEQGDFDMQNRVSVLAKKFNAEVRPTRSGQPCNLHVVCSKPYIMPAAKYLNEHLIVHKGEQVALEPFIDGKYEKFNSNGGWSSGAILPDAFSHWTWAHTNGDSLVCDLQGHRGHPGGPKYHNAEHYYLLTDPAIISRNGRYGMTDLGKAGMSKWFSQHKCNSMCKLLGLDSKRPGP
jgi:hypothetical protein